VEEAMSYKPVINFEDFPPVETLKEACKIMYDETKKLIKKE